MPFTFSHPAAVLPFTFLPSRYYSLTGLIAGSVVPDFEYFIRIRIYSDYSQTWHGLFWFNIPLGLLLCFVFHLLVRDALIDNLPRWFRQRLTVFSSFDWKSYFVKNIPVVLISILIGAISHLGWDAFTHQDGYFVKLWPVLDKAISLGGYPVATYFLLQHISTLLGAGTILFAISRLEANKKAAGRMQLTYWSIFLGSTLLFILGGYFAGKNYWEYGEIIVTGISGGLVGLILAGWKYGKGRSSKDEV
jgi:Domain of unknown function (DUF4184)